MRSFNERKLGRKRDVDERKEGRREGKMIT
jgi:hypothetical protein